MLVAGLIAALPALFTTPGLRECTQHCAAPTSSAPNIVTPLLPSKYAEAQKNSRVTLDGYSKTEIYSGFFTVDESTGSNTYFLYTTPVSGREDAPVLLWLNGGPGASSLLGFYDEVSHCMNFDEPLGGTRAIA